MPTLIAYLRGPMQSWGGRSVFEYRSTGCEPSKSGVIGLIAAALGRARGESLADLVALKLGVRIDSPGELAYDYQIAKQVAKANSSTAETQTSKRYFLEDAAFCIGLEGEHAVLQPIVQALRSPVWPLFLGRKSYVPSEPILSATPPIVDQSLQPALMQAPAFANLDYAPRLRLLLECDAADADEQVSAVDDVPLNFAIYQRGFAQRWVKTLWLPYQPVQQR